ncbi:MAG: aldo/keto reductase, partial [Thiomicrorhabdus sp.]|nr:aldo/keto reductase [Thiomicrorhabdus sp.]
RGDDLKHPTIVEMADKYEKTPAQICLKWQIQREVIVIPKAKSFEHIKDNFDVFDWEISEEDMEKMIRTASGLAPLWENVYGPSWKEKVTPELLRSLYSKM